ncbi:MAG: hypothetical protein EA411_08350 [Saprospirales bacterium]|nr:MAG: hypothetical protein EA411_08350 [Saprospirales bacterium]
MKEQVNNLGDELKDLHPALQKYRGNAGYGASNEKLHHLGDKVKDSLRREKRPVVRRLFHGPMQKAAAVALILIASALIYLVPGHNIDQMNGEMETAAIVNYLLEDQSYFFYRDELLMEYLGEWYLEVMEEEWMMYEEEFYYYYNY